MADRTPQTDSRKLHLSTYPHVLTGAPLWKLTRDVDGKTEAAGFESQGEAVQWAAIYGWVVVLGSFDVRGVDQ